MEFVYLSRRNLLTLLSKLDRKAQGEETACAIIKYDNVHPEYPTSCAPVVIAAIEDNDYYTDRRAGAVDLKDDPDGIVSSDPA